VENPEPVRGEIDTRVVTNTQQVISEFSDMLAEVSGALEDGEGIDAGEAARIRKEWEELKSLCESFVTACEEGVFSK